MAKMIEVDGKAYRMRRGKLVEIPKKWLGKITTAKTIRRRPSKINGSLKRAVKNDGAYIQYKDRRDIPPIDFD